MDDLCTPSAYPDPMHPGYEAGFANLERRAARGQLTLAQLRREVHVLRNRFAGGRPVALYMPRQRR